MSQGASRRAARVVVACVVLAACALAARGLDGRAVQRAVAGASLPLVAAAVALNLAHVWLCAAAWSLMLSPVAPVPLRRSLRHNLIAFAASSALPALSGDLLRVGMLKTYEGVPIAAGAAVSLVDKVIGVIALLILAAPLPWLLPSLPRWVSAGLAGMGAAALVALALVWLASTRAERLSPRLARFAEGARVLRDPRVFLGALGLITAQWLVDAATVHLVLRALDLQVHWAGAFLVLLVLHVAIAAPLTPAQAGAFEVGVVAALAALGVDRERAVAFALVFHAQALVSYGAFGLAALAWPVAWGRRAS